MSTFDRQSGRNRQRDATKLVHININRRAINTQRHSETGRNTEGQRENSKNISN